MTSVGIKNWRVHMPPVTNDERQRIWVKATKLSFVWKRFLGGDQQRRREYAKLIYQILRLHGHEDVIP